MDTAKWNARATERYPRMAFTFKNARVYDMHYIKELAPKYFGAAPIKQVVEKKAIPPNQYFFASYSTKLGYRECSVEYKNKRVLLNAEWVERNVPEFAQMTNPVVKQPTPPPGEVPLTSFKRPHSFQQPKTYEPQPPLLNIEPHEVLKTPVASEPGVIEIRGERHVDRIWFRARDVERMLELSDITGTIYGVNSSYEEGTHYKTFAVVNNADIQEFPAMTRKPGNQTALYLSYWGLVKMLFARRHSCAIAFQKWAIDTLFKQHVAAPPEPSTIGVSTKTLREVLSSNVTALPVVYLFGLGSAGDLRKQLNVPDNFPDSDIIVKFGLTNDLRRRAQEHENTLGRLTSPSCFGLIYHTYVDPFYLGQAEADIKSYFINAQWHLKHPKHTELASVPVHMLNTLVQSEYRRLGNTYAGKLQDLQTQLINEQRINTQLKNQIEAQERYHEDAIASRDRLYDTVMYEKEARLKERDEVLGVYKTIVLNRCYWPPPQPPAHGSS